MESGLDYFGARYYSSMLGRFLTPDWAPKPAAVPYASFGDPQSLNLYAYVRNNPMTGIDADGHVNTSDDGPGGVDTMAMNAGMDTGMEIAQVANPAMPTGQTSTSGNASASNPPTPPGDNGSAQQHDITPQQGESILKEAQTYNGTPYSQNTVPPNNTRGQKGPNSSVDCSHLVCFAASIPYATADGLQHSSHLRPLKPGEARQAADVIIFTDAKGHGFHTAFWDPNPPVPGHNVYGATSSRNNPNGNMQWLPLYNSRGQSTFGGTPTFYRLIQ